MAIPQRVQVFITGFLPPPGTLPANVRYYLQTDANAYALSQTTYNGVPALHATLFIDPLRNLLLPTESFLWEVVESTPGRFTETVHPLAAVAPIKFSERVFNVGAPAIFPKRPLNEVEARLFPPYQRRKFDLLVIGSGMGGGVVAEEYARRFNRTNGNECKTVAVLERGGCLFPTHIAGLPRRQLYSRRQVYKHVWNLWDDFKHLLPTTTPQTYVGAEARNLGGRSIFWGAFIPRLSQFELQHFPPAVQTYLTTYGYPQAETQMGKSTQPDTLYRRQINECLYTEWPDLYKSFSVEDAPVSTRQRPEGSSLIPGQVFNTAHLLTESMLSEDNDNLYIFLHQNVNKIRYMPGTAYPWVIVTNAGDRFEARQVVLAAGTVSSLEILKRSILGIVPLILNKGRKIIVNRPLAATYRLQDHSIYVSHFSILPSIIQPLSGMPGAVFLNKPNLFYSYNQSGKYLIRPRFNNNTAPYALTMNGASYKFNQPFIILLELGADLNQGGYVDDQQFVNFGQSNQQMVGEIVFLFQRPLDNSSSISNATSKVSVSDENHYQDNRLHFMQNFVNAMKQVINFELIDQPNTDYKILVPPKRGDYFNEFFRAPYGGVAHEVGTIPMTASASLFSVDEQHQLRVLGKSVPNFYVCDLSVFPISPAANPSLTLVALAQRLGRSILQ